MAGRHVEYVNVNVYKLTDKELGEIVESIRQRLASTHTRFRPVCPVLPAVNDEYRRWFDVRLFIDETTWVTVRLRRDNLYVQGYQRPNGQWYELGNEHLIDPNSIFLGFDHNYNDLLGEAGYEELTEVYIGAQNLINAAQSLANSDVRRDRARAVLVVAQMFCEAARFIDILDHITTTFVLSLQIPAWMDALVRCWDTFSNLILWIDNNPDNRYATQTVPTPNGDVEATTANQLLGYLGILLRDPRTIGPPSGPKPN